jgi:catechol-2,3-dioxygenase
VAGSSTIGHVHLRVSDVEASKRFYHAAFISLGLPDVLTEGKGFFYADELFVDKADGHVSRVHWHSRQRTARQFMPSTKRHWPRAVATTVLLASAPTILATMVLSF